jgi:hypothetical protein
VILTPDNVDQVAALLQDHVHTVLLHVPQDILIIFQALVNIIILDIITLTVPQLQEVVLQGAVIIMDHVQFHLMIAIIDMVISILILRNIHIPLITLIAIPMRVLAHQVAVLYLDIVRPLLTSVIILIMIITLIQIIITIILLIEL